MNFRLIVLLRRLRSSNNQALEFPLVRGLVLRLTGMLFIIMPVACISAGDPTPQSPQFQVVPVHALHPEAQFATIGSVGIAYRVFGTGDFRLPVPSENVSSLLPQTIRIFRFDETSATWIEHANSYFDAETNDGVGQDLVPGYYTLFGWSANPAENAMQRLLLDAQSGYRSEAVPFTQLNQLREYIASQPSQLRQEVLRGYIQMSFTQDITTCGGSNDASCPRVCRNWSTPRSSCPDACLEDVCCHCHTGPITERAYIPESMLPAQPACEGWLNGQLCPTCPHGWSCPTGIGREAGIVQPIFDVPDYAGLQGINLGELVADEVLRDVLHDAVQEILGRQYPVPPPWP